MPKGKEEIQKPIPTIKPGAEKLKDYVPSVVPLQLIETRISGTKRKIVINNHWPMKKAKFNIGPSQKTKTTWVVLF